MKYRVTIHEPNQEYPNRPNWIEIYQQEVDDICVPELVCIINRAPTETHNERLPREWVIREDHLHRCSDEKAAYKEEDYDKRIKVREVL